MKLLGHYLLAFGFAFLQFTQGMAQESRFYVKLKSAAMNFAPDLIEERISLQENGNCRNEKYYLYRKKTEVLDSSFWSVCVSNTEVSILKNEAPYHQFKCEEGEQQGIISQVKGKILVKPISDSVSGKIKVWEISDKFDQRYKLYYNPEAKRVESQLEPFSQRHALQNFMFREIPDQMQPFNKPAASIYNLKTGDALQLVYYETNDSALIPRQINEYMLLERDVKGEFPVTRFSFTSTDLSSGVTINNDTVEVQELPDGIFIGSALAIPYHALKSGFYRVDPVADIWRCVLLPREDFDQPMLEFAYSEMSKLGEDSLELYRYFVSALPYRISWIHDFPLPFQEYEKVRPKIEYLKRGGVEWGKRMERNAMLLPGIRYFDETPDGFRLNLFIGLKGKYILELRNGNDEVLNVIPSTLNLKAGMQKLEIAAPAKQPDMPYKLILKQLVDSGETVVQEFVFRSRYF
jgi:hypothetical protein